MSPSKTVEIAYLKIAYGGKAETGRVTHRRERPSYCRRRWNAF